MATHGSPAPTREEIRRASAVGQGLTLAFGIVFVVIGIWGFLITGVDGDWLDHSTGEEILGLFEVNNLHNSAHLLFGVAGIVAARRLAWSLWWNIAGAIAYGGLVLYGLVAVDEDWDVLAINPADNWLHLALALAMAAVAAVCWAALRKLREAATIDLRERTTPAPSARQAERPADRTTRTTGTTGTGRPRR